MASFIKIQTQTNIDAGNGVGFLINPEKIVSVLSDGGDPTFTYVSFVLSSIPSRLVSSGSTNVSVRALRIGAVVPAASTGFPVTEAMNKAIETAISTPGIVVDFNAILKGIAVDGFSINSTQSLPV
mgnify:CR=1 FL=1|tara:strand:+ start:101 stop:478 length:378 start_codon:yes stop_codon:yes gene_type:complete